MPTNLQVQTFDGVPQGSVLDTAPYEIPDGFARLIFDAYSDNPNRLLLRGPLKPHSSYTSGLPTGHIANALFATTDPNGTTGIGVITSAVGSSVSNLYFFDTNLGFVSNIVLQGATGSTIEGPWDMIETGYGSYTDIKPALGGGCLIGMSSEFDLKADCQVLALWRGAKKPYYGTTTTFTQGSYTVTGTGFVANVAPGMFMTAHAANNNSWTPLIGVVKKINSDTTLTLEDPALLSPEGSDQATIFNSIRGIEPRIATGLITTTTGSGIVTGTDTKFKTQGINQSIPISGKTPLYDLYRRFDMKWIGRVNSVTNDTSLNLVANSTIDATLEEYVAIPRTSYYACSLLQRVIYKEGSPGWLNVTYNERQWYANLAKKTSQGQEFTNRAWFSEIGDLEAIDFSPQDGNFINIDSDIESNTPITAMATMKNSLLFFKEDGVWKLTGSSPLSYVVKKLSNDGATTPMSVTSFQDGVVWIGRNGIYGYDGFSIFNFLEGSVAKWWQDALKGINLASYAARIAVYKDKILARIDYVNNTVPICKGATRETPTYITLVIDTKTRAVVFFRNVPFLSNLKLSSRSSGPGDHLFLTLAYPVGSVVPVNPYICSFNDIFGGTGVDTLIRYAGEAGPKFFLETKKYSAGQLLQKKRWKLLMLNYLASGPLKVDLVVGLETERVADQILTFPSTRRTWDSLGSEFSSWDKLGTSIFSWDLLALSVKKLFKNKFMKPNTLISLRFYPETSPITELALYNWALGSKFYRAGRL